MKQIFGAIVMGSALLCGCGSEIGSPPSSAHSDDQRLTVASSERSVTPGVQSASAKPAVAAASAKDGMEDPVAQVKSTGQTITMRQLVEPLIEAHGLTMLVNLVELEIVKQNAAEPKYRIVLTEKDFQEEHDRTLEKMFKDSDDAKLQEALDKAIAAKDAAAEAKIRTEIKLEREDYLTQFLVNQHIDRVEFDIVLKINAYLRKILEADWKDKITEADVRSAFGQMYGERVRVRYILLDNLTDVAIAQRRLHNGDSFEQVARDMSRDPRTAPLGGELPPFSREAPEGKVPKVFREAAFALRDNEVSDVVTLGSSFTLIKRIELIPPQAVKFWADKEQKAPSQEQIFVRQKLYDTLIDTGMKAMKQQLAIEAGNELKGDGIKNQILKTQFKKNQDVNENARKKAQAELDRQNALRNGAKNSATTQSTTQPTDGTAPATSGPAPAAGAAAAGERPPATLPGGVHQFTLPHLGPDTQPSILPEANK